MVLGRQYRFTNPRTAVLSRQSPVRQSPVRQSPVRQGAAVGIARTLNIGHKPVLRPPGLRDTSRMRKATRSIILVTLISVVPGSASAVEPEPVVFDVNPGSGGSDPIPIFEFGDRVLFASDDGVHGEELWVSDGSAAGTRSWSRTSSPDEVRFPPSWLFTQVGARVFFTARDGQLWVTDGSAAGTELVWQSMETRRSP